MIILRHFTELRWYTLLLATALYIVVVWTAMVLCGEYDLAQEDNFIYWLLVTASTVGYGDHAPITTAGKWVVALWVIPAGLALFGLILGRFAAFIAFQWRKGVKGLNPIDTTNHILIIGWHETRTLELIRLLRRDSGHAILHRKIVLVVDDDIENPLPGHIGFVRTANCSNAADLERANISAASCIIVNGETDEVTMTVSLACASQNPRAHIIAYFFKEGLGDLLKKHCPNIECVPSVSVELIARAATDPGSSELHHQLLDPHRGMTQFSSEYIGQSTTVRDLFIGMREKFGATLIGLSTGNATPLDLNPPLDRRVVNGNRIHYIAENRINPHEGHDVPFK